MLYQNHGITEPEKIKGETEGERKSTQRNRKEVANGTPRAKRINFYIKHERMKHSTHGRVSEIGSEQQDSIIYYL